MRYWLGIWALQGAGAAHAQSFFDVVWGTDYRSLASAIVVCVIGGLARTTWSLNDKRFVVDGVLREIRGDVIFALITGLFVHLVIEAARPHWEGFTPAARLMIVAGAGFSRMGAMGWLANTVKKASDVATKRIVTAVDSVRGGEQ